MVVAVDTAVIVVEDDSCCWKNVAVAVADADAVAGIHFAVGAECNLLMDDISNTDPCKQILLWSEVFSFLTFLLCVSEFHK